MFEKRSGLNAGNARAQGDVDLACPTRDNAHARADLKACGLNSGQCACVKEFQTACTNKNASRGLNPGQWACASRSIPRVLEWMCNPRAQVGQWACASRCASRGLSREQAAFPWREIRLANVTFEQQSRQEVFRSFPLISDVVSCL